MEEKEKKPWRPPEAAHLPDPIAFAMQGFERFGLPKERLIPPLQTFDRVMQHSAFTENRWWENARQVTATSSAEQWRRVSIERARCLGEPWPDFDDIPVASITEDFSQKCQNATIGLLRDQVIASCAIPGETLFGDIFSQLGIKEDNMDRSLADKKFKKVTIECEDGTTYAGKINHVCGSPYRWDKLCVEAMVEDKPIGAYGIEKVLFQNPATIVFWSDGTKTVVNCMDNVETKKKIVDGKEVIIRKPRKCDTYSKEAGLAMAIVKKWAGNNGNYNNIFRKFIPEMTEEEEKEIRPSIPTCEIGRWYPSFADITAKGDTKQKGIDEIIRYFGIKLEETMAFGDGGNDITMLRHAAIGVAMGQAKEDVKAAADYVTAPIDEDGISKAMKHFGII